MSAKRGASETSETSTTLGSAAFDFLRKRPRLDEGASDISTPEPIVRLMPRLEGAVLFHPALLAGSVAHAGLTMILDPSNQRASSYMRGRVSAAIAPRQLSEDASIAFTYAVMTEQPSRHHFDNFEDVAVAGTTQLVTDGRLFMVRDAEPCPIEVAKESNVFVHDVARVVTLHAKLARA